MVYETKQRDDETLLPDERRAYDEPDVHDDPDVRGEPSPHHQSPGHGEPMPYSEMSPTGEPEAGGEPEPPDAPEWTASAPGVTPTKERTASEPSDLLPGAVPDASLTAVWQPDTAQGFRTRWREVQLRFVDDPRGAATEAEVLLAEVLDVLAEALAMRKAEMDAWGTNENLDTEEMRMAIRRYRDLLDQLLDM